ncbi:MAG: ABC transporter permease, partial [Vicinamibacterales bacterium]
PILSATTVLMFTIGIGLDAGVFTVIDGLLFRPRVASDPASFVELRVDIADDSGRTAAGPFVSLQDYEALAQARSLHDVAAWTPVHAAVGERDGGGESLPMLVSCNFFAAYGPDRPLLGRVLRAEDCAHRDATPVVVIGEDLWRTALAARPNVIGMPLMLNRRVFTVVGVMPSGYSGQLRAPIWIPFTWARQFADGRDLFREPAARWLLGVVGRLQAGVSRTAAASELAVIARQLDAVATNRRTTVTVQSGAMIETPVVRDAAAWFVPLIMAALSLVMLIACANVAMLLLSRSTARQHEMAVRISLGASRSRLLRMLVTESALLAAIAAPPSLAVASLSPIVFRSLIPRLPYYPFAVDTTVVSFLLAVTLFAGVAAGVAPAFESLKKDLSAGLHGQEALAGAIGWHARDVLMAGQVGMSLVLLVGAGLFLHTEWRMMSAGPGYEIDRVMLVVPRVSSPPHTPDSAAAFYDTFTRSVLGIPGVRSLAYQRGARDDDNGRARIETMVATATGITATPGAAAVSSQYFRTLQIPLVGGAAFGDDAVSASAVVSESLAQTLWPGRNPIGESARLGDAEVTVVGVARDVPSATSGAGERAVYRPTGTLRAGDAMYVAFDGSQTETARAIRDAITALDPDAVAQPQTLAAIRRDQASKFMPFVEMVLGLGITALVLGVAGVYGVVSFVVGRRTREMGIRVALGAKRADIVRLVLASGVGPIAVGVSAGLALALVGSWTLARLFRNTPVRVDPFDPIVYASVIVVLSVAAVAAMIGPARRAALADPVHALRQT